MAHLINFIRKFNKNKYIHLCFIRHINERILNIIPVCLFASFAIDIQNCRFHHRFSSHRFFTPSSFFVNSVVSQFVSPLDLNGYRFPFHYIELNSICDDKQVPK